MSAARSQVGWRLLVAAIALCAVAVRLALIAHSHGGADLFNYT